MGDIHVVFATSFFAFYLINMYLVTFYLIFLKIKLPNFITTCSLIFKSKIFLVNLSFILLSCTYCLFYCKLISKFEWRIIKISKLKLSNVIQEKSVIIEYGYAFILIGFVGLFSIDWKNKLFLVVNGKTME